MVSRARPPSSAPDAHPFRPARGRRFVFFASFFDYLCLCAFVCVCVRLCVFVCEQRVFFRSAKVNREFPGTGFFSCLLGEFIISSECCSVQFLFFNDICWKILFTFLDFVFFFFEWHAFQNVPIFQYTEETWNLISFFLIVWNENLKCAEVSSTKQRIKKPNAWKVYRVSRYFDCPFFVVNFWSFDWTVKSRWTLALGHKKKHADQRWQDPKKNNFNVTPHNMAAVDQAVKSSTTQKKINNKTTNSEEKHAEKNYNSKTERQRNKERERERAK